MKCEWCEDEEAEAWARKGAPRLCLECREDGVEKCAICRRLWVPHGALEEQVAERGHCPNCHAR